MMRNMSSTLFACLRLFPVRPVDKKRKRLTLYPVVWYNNGTKQEQKHMNITINGHTIVGTPAEIASLLEQLNKPKISIGTLSKGTVSKGFPDGSTYVPSTGTVEKTLCLHKNCMGCKAGTCGGVHMISCPCPDCSVRC